MLHPRTRVIHRIHLSHGIHLTHLAHWIHLTHLTHLIHLHHSIAHVSPIHGTPATHVSHVPHVLHAITPIHTHPSHAPQSHAASRTHVHLSVGVRCPYALLPHATLHHAASLVGATATGLPVSIQQGTLINFHLMYDGVYTSVFFRDIYVKRVQMSHLCNR